MSDIKVCVKGGGDIASGVTWRLHHSGFRVFITEIGQPTTVRRGVAFSEAVYNGNTVVEGLEAVLVQQAVDAYAQWEQGKIPVFVDPDCDARHQIRPDVIVDAILAKKNTGTTIRDAPLVIGLGPDFEAGRDVNFVVETNRGHWLGRLLLTGAAEPDTHEPSPVLGITNDRVIRAPADGQWKNKLDIGRPVRKGDLVGSVSGVPVNALIDGILRGMIHPGINVKAGLKIGDIDPRGRKEYCYFMSDKALAIAGGVLEGILIGSHTCLP